MGHIAELMLDGTLCTLCATVIDHPRSDKVHWPRICSDCAEGARERGEAIQYDGFGGYCHIERLK